MQSLFCVHGSLSCWLWLSLKGVVRAVLVKALFGLFYCLKQDFDCFSGVKWSVMKWGGVFSRRRVVEGVLYFGTKS